MTEQMKPSGIACVGDIPQDWDVKRLKYACQQITDGSHFSQDTVDDGYQTMTHHIVFIKTNKGNFINVLQNAFGFF